MRPFALITILIALLSWPTNPAFADDVPAGSPAVEQANKASIYQYHLTEEFLEGNFAYTLFAAKQPCKDKVAGASIQAIEHMDKKPIEDIIDAYAAAPGVADQLAQFNLSPRDALLGGMVMLKLSMHQLQSSTSFQQLSGNNKQPEPLTSPIMQQNLAFYKAHQAEIDAHKQKVMNATKAMLEKHGGKMPQCMIDRMK